MSEPASVGISRRRVVSLRRLVAAFIVAVLPLLSSPLEAKKRDQWIAVQHERLLVYSNLSKSKLLEQLEVLAEFRRCVEAAFPQIVIQQNSPTLLLIAKDQETFDQFLPYVNNRLLNVSGLYLHSSSFRAVLILNDGKRERQGHDLTILHEYVHEIMIDGDYYPAWAAEGIAEALSHFRKRSSNYAIGEDTLMRRKLYYRKSELRMPLWDMFSINVGSRRYHSPHHQRAFYNTSWLFAHYCLVSDGRAFEDAYFELAEIARKRAVTDGDIIALFGMTLWELDSRLLKYANEDKVSHLKVPRTESVRVSGWGYRPAEKEELLALRAIILNRVDRVDEVKGLLHELTGHKDWRRTLTRHSDRLHALLIQSELLPAE